MGVDERMIKIVSDLEEISKIAKENRDLINKINETLATVVLRLDTHRIYSVSVKISKYVRETYDHNFRVEDCYDCVLETDGEGIYVEGRLYENDVKLCLLKVQLDYITLQDLLLLHRLFEANEGSLDALIDALKNQKKELYSKLEELKRVIALVKVSTSP